MSATHNTAARRRVVFRSAFAATLAVVQSAGAQSSNSPNPDVYDTDGPVFAIVQSGTTIYVGGSFTSVGSTDGSDSAPRSNLAAISAVTGQVTDWNPGVEGTVFALAVSADGETLYVGGDIVAVGGQPRGRIAAIDTSSGAVTGWNPDANGTIETLTFAEGTVYAGGSFTVIGGQTRDFIAAIDAATGSATDWDAHANSPVEALAVAGSALYVGGGFTQIGGQPRNRIAALELATAEATAWNPDANSTVFSLAVSSSGSTVYAGGFFNSIGGQARSFLGAVDASTGLATSWAPEANSIVYALAVSSDDAIVYAGGFFNVIGGQSRDFAAALEAGNGQATAWDPSPSSAVWALATAEDIVYVGGWFTSIGGGLIAYFAYFGELINVAPDPPSNLGPASYVDGSSGTLRSPTLQFTQSDGNLEELLSYWIQIDDDADFSSPLVDETSAFMVEGAASHAVNIALPVDSYYWRVSSDDGDLFGDWADANGGAVAFVITQPTVDFAHATYSVDEMGETIIISIALSQSSAETITVDYASSDGTATVGADYTALGGTLTFAPGETSKSIELTILDDVVSENDEDVVLTLSNPTNAELGQDNNPATLTIFDDDGGGTSDIVTICHVPPGNPDKAHTIRVHSAAVSAHLNHGDYLGECAADDDSDSDDDDDSDDQDNRVKLCHVSPGKHGRAHTITVSQSAVEAHLKYGDHLGACADSDPGESGVQRGDDEEENIDEAGDSAVVRDGHAELQLAIEHGSALVSLTLGSDDDEELNVSANLSVSDDDDTEGMPGAALPIRLNIETGAPAAESDGVIILSIEVRLGDLSEAGIDQDHAGMYRRDDRGSWIRAGRDDLGESDIPPSPQPGQTGHAVDGSRGMVRFWVVESLSELAARREGSSRRQRSSGDSLVLEYAVGEVATYSLNISGDPVDGGTVAVSPDRESYNAGSQVTLIAAAAIGFEFVGWEGVDSSSDSITLTLNDDLELVAIFEERPVIDDVPDGPADDDQEQSDTPLFADDEPVTLFDVDDVEPSDETDENADDDVPDTNDDIALCGAVGSFNLLLMLSCMVGMTLRRRRLFDSTCAIARHRA